MTINTGNFTEHIRRETDKPQSRYNLTHNITCSKSQRAKQLGHHRYLKESIRKQILERDNYTCQICGRYGNVVDHISPWRISKDHSPENLRCLCVQCNIETRLERRDARLPVDEWEEQIRQELELHANYINTQLEFSLTS